MRTKGPRTRSTLRATALAIPLLLVGCGEMQDDATADEASLAGDAFTNPTGASRVVTVNGATIDENNPFFQNLG